MITQPAQLIIGISSRALFDLRTSHDVFATQGLEKYREYQIAHEQDVLTPGPSFAFVQKLLALNTHAAVDEPIVEVILLSRNSSDTGLRVFNSIEHHQLKITRAVFCSGASPYPYMQPFGCHLFLSVDAADVCMALRHGVAAATIIQQPVTATTQQQLRIAFDGDAVIFSDQAEQINVKDGLAAFNASERQAANIPLQHGPFSRFIHAVELIQRGFVGKTSPLRTALVTARGAPAHKRVILTLRSWGLQIDEAIFLSGLEKNTFIEQFGADIYFDDRMHHVQQASEKTTAAHVPDGVCNQGSELASASSVDSNHHADTRD